MLPKGLANYADQLIVRYTKAHCYFCDGERAVSVHANALPAPERVPDALDTAAASRCPCLLDALWDKDLHGPVTHRGTQRKRIREALLECSTKEDFEERREALRQRLAALQPAGRVK